jgi:hypothetical protein
MAISIFAFEKELKKILQKGRKTRMFLCVMHWSWQCSHYYILTGRPQGNSGIVVKLNSNPLGKSCFADRRACSFC